MAHKI